MIFTFKKYFFIEKERLLVFLNLCSVRYCGNCGSNRWDDCAGGPSRAFSMVEKEEEQEEEQQQRPTKW